MENVIIEKEHLKRVDVYTILSPDNEMTSSEKGYYLSYDIANEKSKGSGWYGSNGEVLTKVNIYMNSDGELFQVTPLGYPSDSLVKDEHMMDKISEKLTKEELEFITSKIKK